MTDASGRAPDGTFYRGEGPPDAPPVLLLHGVGLDLALWDALVPLLATRWRVLRYDLLGHGRSADPRGERRLDDFLAQLDTLLDHLGLDLAALVGFSMGGIVARAYAASRPQRVSRLVVMSSVFERSAVEREAVAARCAAVARGGPAANLEPALARWFTPAFAAAQPAVIARVRDVVAANGPGYLKAYRVFAEADAEPGAALADVACPTLVMTGAEDAGAPPAMARALASRIPGATVAVLPGLRHLAPLEAPGKTGRRLAAFLAGAG